MSSKRKPMPQFTSEDEERVFLAEKVKEETAIPHMKEV
jgi:hypothetical protein